MISPGRRTSITVKRNGSDLMQVKKTRPSAGSLCCWISRAKKLGSIFRNDRSRSPQVELVVEADLDLVFLYAAVSDKGCCRR